MSIVTEALETALAKDLAPDVRAALAERLAALDAPRFSEADHARIRVYNQRVADFCTLAYRPGQSLESLTALLRAAYEFADATS